MLIISKEKFKLLEQKTLEWHDVYKGNKTLREYLNMTKREYCDFISGRYRQI
jgi:cell shape-determining protein MreC